VETQKITTDGLEDEISVRDVRLEALYPSLATPQDILGPLDEDKKLLVKRLKDRGMQP
jgi:hypothetical protein